MCPFIRADGAAREHCARELCISQGGAAEVGGAYIGSGQIGGGHVRMSQSGPLQLRALKGRLHKFSVIQVGAFQYGAEEPTALA